MDKREEEAIKTLHDAAIELGSKIAALRLAHIGEDRAHYHLLAIKYAEELESETWGYIRSIS
jgi:hypothetical protein